MTKIKGSSLIEMMLAITLGTILTMTITTCFHRLYHQMIFQKTLIELQRQIRFIAFYLTYRIHRAGYLECELNRTKKTIFKTVMGYNADRLPRGFAIQAKSGTDILMVNECVYYHRQQQRMSLLFFISDTHRKGHDGQPIYALFQKLSDSPRLELADDVISMNVLYGTIENNEIHYQSSEQVQHWDLVKIVLLQLLFRSQNSVLKKPQHYWFNNKIIEPDDRNKYQPLVFTVALRTCCGTTVLTH